MSILESGKWQAASIAVGIGLLAAVGVVLADEFTVRRIATGLEQPVYVTAPPGDTARLFVVEANSGGSPSGPTIAEIRILHLTGPSAGTIDPTPFLTIGGIPQQEDQGVFCLAFHPNYAGNGLFYVTYAFGSTGGESRVERYQVSGANPDVADPASATVILKYPKPFFNHNGDWLGFSPNEVAQGKYYLYHTTGDGGSNLDPMELAQDLSTKYGKVLRIDVGADGLADDFPADPDANYAIPADNPLVGVAGTDPSIWGIGLRNPWRASFDRLTSDLYIGNVGANASDEVEFQPASSSGGENYGWSRLEGTVVGPNPGSATPADQFPMYECLHGGSLTECAKRSITGGYVYRGPVQELAGHYIHADFLGTYNFGNQTGEAQVFSIRYDGSDPSIFDGTNVVNDETLNRTAQFAPTGGGTLDFISSFGEDGAGDLYIVDMGNLGTPDGQGLGEIYQVCGICEICLPGQPSVAAFCSIDGLVSDADRQTLTWNLAAGADSYDVIRGDLNALRSTGGRFDLAVTGCVEPASPDTSSTHAPAPPSGEGFFYLVRGSNASGDGGSYDSGGAGQVDFRDGEIHSSFGGCL
ncbi:MAG: PQQ-dependent sugar dehydrogenase [bacterium]|nr:PQQ-dependent sugar dehydrogenase [bacterium]